MLMTTIPTPIGVFQGYADERGLHRLLFPDSPEPDLPAPATTVNSHEHPVFSRTAEQLNQYLLGKRRSFDLPLCSRGTDFQQRVWDLLSAIPYGKTCSYGELAEKLGNRNKARAVGGAAHVNPLPIVIPCHRLIGTDGRLTGFAGGLRVKRYLLELEKDILQQNG